LEVNSIGRQIVDTRLCRADASAVRVRHAWIGAVLMVVVTTTLGACASDGGAAPDVGDGGGGAIAFVASEPKPAGEFQTSTYELPDPTDVYTVRPDGSALRRVSTDGAPKGALAWSPDGTKLAYTAFPLDAGREQLWISAGEAQPEMRCGGCTGTFLIPPPDAIGDSYIGPEPGWAGLAWSPDGRWLAAPATDKRDLALISPTTGKITVIETPQVRGISWAPDSSSIAISGGGSVTVYDVARKTSKTLASVGYLPGGPVAWSPSGKSIAAADSVRKPHIIEEGVFIVDVATRDVTDAVPVDGTFGVYDLEWAPDSDRLAVLYHPIDPPTAGLMTIAPDGSRERSIAFCENHVDADGLCTTNGGSVAWSPDGTRLLFVNWPEAGKPQVVSIAEGSPTVVSGDLVPGCCLAWGAGS
jgi:WD40 repeat protein